GRDLAKVGELMRALPLLLVLAPAGLVAQAPSTDIYVASLQRKSGVLTVGAPVNATARAGYDNQPFFTPDCLGFYYTSQRGTQTDIYRYDLAEQRAVAVVSTPESEYSPTLTPDGRHLSVIRVELDSAQRLWALPLDGGAGKPVLDTIKPVGYHVWL